MVLPTELFFPRLGVVGAQLRQSRAKTVCLNTQVKQSVASTMGKDSIESFEVNEYSSQVVSK
jgi:hypothetical protein